MTRVRFIWRKRRKRVNPKVKFPIGWRETSARIATNEKPKFLTEKYVGGHYNPLRAHTSRVKKVTLPKLKCLEKKP